MDKAESLIRRVVNPRENIDAHDLDNPEQRWFYVMFLQSLGRYLGYKQELCELDAAYYYARASLLHYARWMTERAVPFLDRPELVVFPTETWPAQDIRKSDVFFFAARHSAPSDIPRLLERGEFFHRVSTETLTKMSTRTLVRPVAILLSSGYMRGWITRQKVIGELEPGAVAFPSPEGFVPQRRRAEKRAKQIAIAGTTGFVAIAVWVFFFLL
jgi:hypothetical protein